jgi:long-chain acyl-CoA synthetase
MSAPDDATIFSTFSRVAAERPDATAVIYLGTRYSYRRVATLSRQMAAALAALGVAPQKRVMIYLPNSIQWVVSWLGIQQAGAVGVPITPIYTPHDLAYIASDCEAGTIICADTNYGYVQQVLADTRIKRVVVARMTDLLPWAKRAFGRLFDVVPTGRVARNDVTWTIRGLLSRYRSATPPRPAVDGRAVAEILYTGGTTKFPKGVPITHDLFLTSAMEQVTVSEPLIPVQDNIVFGNAPLFHILGQTCSLATVLVGGALLIQPKINLDAAFDAIQRFRVRSLVGVPTLYRMMLDHDRLDQYDLSSVDYWFSAGDMLPVELGNRWRRRFGKPIYQGYGATETCGGVSMCPAGEENPPKSVGRIVASKRVRVVDPTTLAPVDDGQPGELLVHSEHMVSRYLNKPEETQEAFIRLDGRLWYRTADVMQMDAAGHLTFVDRTVDTIKHKGYRVSASEIEAVLQEHPAVIDTCVVGIPDEKVGQRIKAYVVLREDIKGITGVDLLKWCRGSLVAYKVPQYIEFRDMLPKSKVGKLLRREIRDEEKRRAEG